MISGNVDEWLPLINITNESSSLVLFLNLWVDGITDWDNCRDNSHTRLNLDRSMHVLASG